MSLLEEAKKISVKRYRAEKYTREDLDLVHAWLNEEISLDSIRTVKKLKSPNLVYNYISFVLREFHKKEISR